MQITRHILVLVMLFSTLTTLAQTTDTIVTPTFEKVEKEATFPGNTQGWIKYLQANLNANVPVDRGAPVGKYTVYVQFIVRKDGSVSDIKALTSLGYGMETEVIRIIRKSGLWEPAIMKGQPVNAYRKQPVTFMVTQDGLDIQTETPYTLYTGKENQLIIHDRGTKELKTTISKGTITATSDDRFIVHVNETGRVVVSVFNKKNKKVADVSFEVRD